MNGSISFTPTILFQGIAFPTCLSVNHAICHFSPLVSEADQTLAEGDMVKIDMGAHIDGYIAVVAHTVVVGGGVITGDNVKNIKHKNTKLNLTSQQC